MFHHSKHRMFYYDAFHWQSFSDTKKVIIKSSDRYQMSSIGQCFQLGYREFIEKLLKLL